MLRGLRGLAGAALAAAAVSFAGIGSHSLWTPDEPRDAAVGKAMWASGDLIVPRLNGRPFLEKPPLAWWAQAAAFRVLGTSDAAARASQALFATLTLLATFALARRLGGTRAGWLAAGALACTVEFSEDMGRAIVDPALVLTVTLAYAGFVVLLAPRPAPPEGDGLLGHRRLAAHERAGAYLVIALAVPLAFLAKGVVGIGLALGPPILYLTGAAAIGSRGGGRGGDLPAENDVRGPGGTGATGGPGAGGPRRARDGGAPRGLPAAARLLAPLALLGVPLFAAVVLPWALALLREGGWDAVRECLVGNTVGRLLSTTAGRAYGHRQPFWYYLPAGAAALLPWTLALPALLAGGAKGEVGVSGAETATGGTETATGGTEIATGGTETGDDAGRNAGAAPPRAAAEAARRLLIAAFLLGVLLLSLAVSKRALYLVPLLPALAVPLGLWLDGLGRGAPRSRWDRPTGLALLALAGALPGTLCLGAWVASRGGIGAFPAAPLSAELTAGRLAAAGLVAAAGGGLLLWRLARHLRDGSTPAGAWLVLPFLVLTVAYQTAVKSAIDPLKNPHDLTAAVARLDPGTGPVLAYRPSEPTLGIVGFDLGRPVEPLATPAALAARVATQARGRLVLSLADWRHLPTSLRARLPLLYDETATKASPQAIAAWSPEPPG